MKVELLYLDGCPGRKALAPRLAALLSRGAVDAPVEQRRVESEDAAFEERFLGSPTVRIDGVDVEPGAADRRDYGLKCRLYRTRKGLSPLPLIEWVEEALRRAAITAGA